MQKKLFELLGKPVCDGDVGIEIETEGKNLVEMSTVVWKSEDDGSLRGRYPDTRAEYVLKKPILLDQVVPALTKLKVALDENDAKLEFSYRCSVHVHVNVQQLTYTQLLNMIYTYLLLEEPLMNLCGKKRKGNNFCLRLADAEGLLERLNNMFSRVDRVGLQYLPGNEERYSAINLAALSKYGSVEFRAMEGNLDINRIKLWCDVLVGIRNYATRSESPSTIFAEYAATSPEHFFKSVLGGFADPLLYPRLTKDIQQSFSISLDLPMAYARFAEAEAKKPVWNGEDFQVGDHVTYEEAIDLIRRQGQVSALPARKVIWEDARYEVIVAGEQPPDMEVIRRVPNQAKVQAPPAPPAMEVNWAQDVFAAPGIVDAVAVNPAPKRRVR